MEAENKKISNAEDTLKNNDKYLLYFNKTAKDELNKLNPEKAYEYFSKAENVYGCAYCRFLEGKTDEAVILLKLIENSSSAVNWLLFLIDLINGEKKYKPTYFQLRNFYEPDLNMLFKYKRIDYINIILKEIPYLLMFNREVYKYTARVFLDNKDFKSALFFLNKSVDIFYKDPEVHFMLAEAHLALNDKEEAKREYIKSSEVTDGYFPAQKKLRELN